MTIKERVANIGEIGKYITIMLSPFIAPIVVTLGTSNPEWGANSFLAECVCFFGWVMFKGNEKRY